MKKKPAVKRSKSPNKSPKRKVGPLVVPEHGRGRIYQGPAAHPVAGSGRPPNALRAVMRLHLSEVIPKLYEKWQAKEIDDIQYAEYLAKYAIGPLKGVSESEIETFTRDVAEIVFQECGAEVFQRVSARLAELAAKRERGE